LNILIIPSKYDFFSLSKGIGQDKRKFLAIGAVDRYPVPAAVENAIADNAAKLARPRGVYTGKDLCSTQQQYDIFSRLGLPGSCPHPLEDPQGCLRP